LKVVALYSRLILNNTITTHLEMFLIVLEGGRSFMQCIHSRLQTTQQRHHLLRICLCVQDWRMLSINIIHSSTAQHLLL